MIFATNYFYTSQPNNTVATCSEKRTENLNSGNSGSSTPGSTIPLICLSETISSYDRCYRSDTHVLRRTEGSSRLSDELPCRVIFTNLTAPPEEEEEKNETAAAKTTPFQGGRFQRCAYMNLRCAATFNEMLILYPDPAREEAVVKRSQRKKSFCSNPYKYLV